MAAAGGSWKVGRFIQGGGTRRVDIARLEGEESDLFRQIQSIERVGTRRMTDAQGETLSGLRLRASSLADELDALRSRAFQLEN